MKKILCVLYNVALIFSIALIFLIFITFFENTDIHSTNEYKLIETYNDNLSEKNEVNLDTDDTIISKYVQPIFNKDVKSCELIYNLDDSADYIYV